MFTNVTIEIYNNTIYVLKLHEYFLLIVIYECRSKMLKVTLEFIIN